MKHAWAKDTTWIKAHYMTMTNAEMAKVLGCTPGAMSTQLSKMDLRRHVKAKANGKGQPCPPPALDLMHNGDYVPPKSYCPREEGLEYKLLPSLNTGVQAVYHEGHP